MEMLVSLWCNVKGTTEQLADFATFPCHFVRSSYGLVAISATAFGGL